MFLYCIVIYFTGSWVMVIFSQENDRLLAFLFPASHVLPLSLRSFHVQRSPRVRPPVIHNTEDCAYAV